MPPRERVKQDVNDIRDPDQLIRFATSAQLARVEQQGIQQNRIARGSRIGESNLTKCLTGESPLSYDKLRRLDDSIVAHAPEMERTGGLRQLSVRLHGLTDQTGLSVTMPASRARKFLKLEPRNQFDVMDQASVLVSLFLALENGGSGHRALRVLYHDKLKTLVERLILIGIAPPTPDNIEALILLGSLAKYSFDATKHQLEDALRAAPVGFRVWRAITKLVLISSDPAKNPTAFQDQVKAWIRELLGKAELLREGNLYPGRSLDIELALAVPYAWSRPEDRMGDWVDKFLKEQVERPGATIRERGMAALGIWERTLGAQETGQATPAQTEETERYLRRLIDKFRDPKTRPDAAAGLRWIAETLDQVLETKTATSQDWPKVNEPWFETVRSAVDYLDSQEIPAQILPAMKVLFQHTLLQNAGLQRRRAIDTLLASGMTEPIVGALDKVLNGEPNEAWLRIRALFALGFLQQRDPTVAGILVPACRDAYTRLTEPPTPATQPSAAQINEMHAVLFAIGDCFGPPEAAEISRNVRNGIAPVLRGLTHSDMINEREYRQVARALVYVLTMTAQPRLRPDQEDLAHILLKKLTDHTDATTANFADWALGFRFGEDGSIHPLLEAAQFSGRFFSA